jgi:hypothetical protein
VLESGGHLCTGSVTVAGREWGAVKKNEKKRMRKKKKEGEKIDYLIFRNCV